MTRNLEPVSDGPELPSGPFDLPITEAGLSVPLLKWIPIDPALCGGPYRVQAYNRDMVQFEETAATHGWKANSPGNAPFKWLAFLAWAALRRNKVITVAWPPFEENTAEVSDLNNATATPTPPGPDPG